MFCTSNAIVPLVWSTFVSSRWYVAAYLVRGSLLFVVGTFDVSLVGVPLVVVSVFSVSTKFNCTLLDDSESDADADEVLLILLLFVWLFGRKWC